MTTEYANGGQIPPNDDGTPVIGQVQTGGCAVWITADLQPYIDAMHALARTLTTQPPRPSKAARRADERRARAVAQIEKELRRESQRINGGQAA